MIIYEPVWKSFIATTTNPIFTVQECENIINIGHQQPPLKGKVGGEKDEKDYRASIISWIPFNAMPAMYKIIETSMLQANRNHIGFEGMQLGEIGQFTEYKKGGFYDWHMDHDIFASHQPPVRKISMTVLLSNRSDFEGGQLEFMAKGNKPPALQQGQAIFFASFIRHRVAKVTRGLRRSLVMWFGGPPFK
jgi:PKHD-type hydroxylase